MPGVGAQGEPTERSAGIRQQDQGIPGWPLTWTILAALAIGTAAVAISAWLLQVNRSQRPEATRRPVAAPGRDVSPVLHTRIRHRAFGLRLEQERSDELESYSWVDRERGLVSIPIEEAMGWLVRSEMQRRTSLGMGGGSGVNDDGNARDMGDAMSDGAAMRDDAAMPDGDLSGEAREVTP